VMIAQLLQMCMNATSHAGAIIRMNEPAGVTSHAVKRSVQDSSCNATPYSRAASRIVASWSCA
jgi:hypothetical protein